MRRAAAAAGRGVARNLVSPVCIAQCEASLAGSGRAASSHRILHALDKPGALWPPPCSDTLWQENTLTKFVPFNPTDKYTIAFVKDNKTGTIERVMKGAPQASHDVLEQLWVVPNKSALASCLLPASPSGKRGPGPEQPAMQGTLAPAKGRCNAASPNSMGQAGAAPHGSGCPHLRPLRR